MNASYPALTAREIRHLANGARIDRAAAGYLDALPISTAARDWADGCRYAAVAARYAARGLAALLGLAVALFALLAFLALVLTALTAAVLTDLAIFLAPRIARAGRLALAHTADTLAAWGELAALLIRWAAPRVTHAARTLAHRVGQQAARTPRRMARVARLTRRTAARVAWAADDAAGRLALALYVAVIALALWLGTAAGWTHADGTVPRPRRRLA